MNETIKKITAFRDARDWKQFHSSENLSKSILIEAAELLENFQWSSEFNKEKVTDELADILIYCVLMADTIGVDIEIIMNNKIDKNEKKYPIDKAKGNSKKYTEY